VGCIPRLTEAELIMLFSYFLQGLLFGFAAAVQPGPFQTFLISQTIAHGWRRTLPAVLAPLFSDGPILVLVLLTLSHVPDRVIYGLRLAGGLFILYLAYGAFNAWRHFDSPQGSNRPGPKSLIQAAFVNLLSPNPYLFWSLVGGPLLLTAWHTSPLDGIGLLAGFYLVMIGGNAGMVVLLGITGRLGPRINRLLLGLSGLALLVMGIIQIRLGLLGLLN
jgi:threonine/homoserine/homoserine lactone efflux protein